MTTVLNWLKGSRVSTETPTDKLFKAFHPHEYTSEARKKWKNTFKACLSKNQIAKAERERFAVDMLKLYKDATQAEHDHSLPPEHAVTVAKKWFPTAQDVHPSTLDHFVTETKAWRAAGK